MERNRVIYRQGDVMLVATERPPGAHRRASLTLALGEATGHSHTLEGERVRGYVSDKSWYGRSSRSGHRIGPVSRVDFTNVKAMPDVIVVGREGAVLRHQEHSAIKVRPGYYRVVRQHEHDSAVAGRNPALANRLVYD